MSDKLQPLIPTPIQQDAITAMSWEQSGGALLGAELGVGKTGISVMTALTRGADVTLISAPLHTRWGWYDTVMRQTEYQAEFRWMNNGNKDGKQAFEDFRNSVPGFYFIGRELARSQDWSKCAPDLVIHDECHSFANRGAGFKNAVKLAKVSGFTICQSATWYGSNFSGAWSIARVLWPDNHDIAPPSYHFWEGQWCATVYDNFAPGKKRVTGERNPGEFVKHLPLYINIRSELHEPTDIPVYVDLSVKQRSLYRQMEKDSLAWLNENPLIADLPITQRIRLRQLTLAEAAIGENDEVIFPPDAKSSKLDALRGMLEDFGDEKVLIVTDSAKFARLVAARIGGFAWTGVATGEERDASKVAFSTGGLKYIVATQAAIGEGVDGLQNNCHILVELSASDQVLMNQQTIGRLNRRGQTKQVLVYRILARSTLDDGQADTLLGRELAMRASMRKQLDTDPATE